MAINFRAATDELLACISHQELAEALGVSVASVRQARLGPGAAAHRNPPEGWERAVARLAQDRAARLVRLAGRLKS
jgi:GMP synthase-like glutamine amidotransferase